MFRVCVAKRWSLITYLMAHKKKKTVKMTHLVFGGWGGCVVTQRHHLITNESAGWSWAEIRRTRSALQHHQSDAAS